MEQHRANTKDFGRPLPVEPMRVRRTYSGGAKIDGWHGEIGRYGCTRPEEWIASITGAINPGFPEEPDEGLSRVKWNGQERLLRDLIDENPEPMLGTEHCAAFGKNLGILAKMIDSAERLSIQVHPDKAFSQRWFHSKYGKTECWYILDVHEVEGQKPYLLMGFMPGVTKEKWRHLYETQDIAGMIGSMHIVTPKRGEVWLIEGGLPHAIGPGCCLIELQEPTDYTLRTERRRSDGSHLPEQLIHQGAGDEGLLECFHYDGVGESQLRAQHCISPEMLFDEIAGTWRKLIGEPETTCFSMASANIQTALHFVADGFSVAVVIKGNGRIFSSGGQTIVRQGEQMFFPAAMKEFTVVNDTPGKPVEMLFCYPPKAQIPVVTPAKNNIE